MVEMLVCFPILWGLITFAVSSNHWRPWMLPIGGLVHLAMTAIAIQGKRELGLDGWLNLDPLGKIFLSLISLLFFLLSCYAPGYLAQRQERNNRVVCTCLSFSLGMMTMIVLAHHLGLMWVAMEMTTLVSAPGLYFNHNPRSLEATWKYLLICSVGIALALLGSLLFAYSAVHSGLESTLMFDDLIRQAPQLSIPWLHAALIFLVVGYGTKMGLAPMHTWKPDAYGEAPGMIGALLAGCMTNCAFLALLRFVHIATAAGEGPFIQRLLIFLGLFSMGLAAALMTRQRDFKRMLAYSSIEHMGILALGVGIGGAATFAALFHVIANGLTKCILFLSAGNIHRVYASKMTADVRGVMHRMPWTGSLFLLGFFAITGAPPFAPFISEFSMLAAMFRQGHFWAGGLFVSFLLVTYFGLGATVTSMVFGRPSDSVENGLFHETFATIWPIAVFAVLVIILGVWLPPSLRQMLLEAAAFLEMKPAI